MTSFRRVGSCSYSDEPPLDCPKPDAISWMGFIGGKRSTAEPDAERETAAGSRKTRAWTDEQHESHRNPRSFMRREASSFICLGQVVSTSIFLYHTGRNIYRAYCRATSSIPEKGCCARHTLYCRHPNNPWVLKVETLL